MELLTWILIGLAAYAVAITIFALYNDFDWMRRYEWMVNDWSRYCTRLQNTLAAEFDEKTYNLREALKVYQEREKHEKNRSSK